MTQSTPRDDTGTEPRSPDGTDEVTGLLKAWGDGDATALERLIPIVESALRQQARRLMAGERRGHTLDPTALVNEVYLRLVDRRSVSWDNRANFFAFAGIAMRRILVEHARARGRHKRGGDAIRLDLEDAPELTVAARSVDLLALDQALDELATLDARQAKLVELRFFAGLTIEETAEVLGVSTSFVTREWRVVKAWLVNKLRHAE
ncbi:MAG: sigma-70 family RNA polymerase sigma factor [Acidobacteriota bacterium]